MKRTPIQKQGKAGTANRTARQKIAAISKQKNLTKCELRLSGCMGNWPLAPAHRHKRSFYKGDADKLADYEQWVCACQVCHDKIEFDPELTEKIFMNLRGEE